MFRPCRFRPQRVPTPAHGWVAAVAALMLFAATSTTHAASVFTADLQPLNNSGVTGQATFTVTDQTLTVEVNADGLTPNRVHAQHIHGRFAGAPDGQPINSVVPPPTADADGDGFVEVLEGLPFYGPIILPLTEGTPSPDEPLNFPMANDQGEIDFQETYDLTNDEAFFNPLTGTDFESEDIFPLPLREIVLHGAIVDPQAISDPIVPVGEDGYLPTLPVAAAEIVPVPPAAWAGAALLGALAMKRYRRRRRDA